MKGKASDFWSELFSRVAYKLHPTLGELYNEHIQFFNDGFVELICLIIANVGIVLLSYSFVGLNLALLSLVIVTPITFSIKYLLHKLWVWVPDDS